MKRAGFPIFIGLVVAVMLGIFALGNRQTEEPTPKTRLGTQHASQGQQHIQPGQAHEPYNSNPASSGPHYPAPAPWGVKDSEIADETLVHNLEHGGILIAYKPCEDPDTTEPTAPVDDGQDCLDQAGLERLKTIFGKLPPSPQFNSVKAVLVPRSRNSAPIQLAAWTYTLDLDSPDEAQIIQFYTDHIDQGPELVP